VNSLIKLKKYEKAEGLLKVNINNFINTRYYYTLEVLLSEVYVLNNKPDEAFKYFDSIFVQNPHIIYSNNVLTKKEFFNQGIDSLKKYLVAETKEKYEMLLRLNSDSVRSFSIPVLINSCSDSVRIKNTVNLFRDKINATDLFSSYALLKLSEASEKINYYDFAKELLVKALNYKRMSILLLCYRKI
jgi:tetratricopeptide (TPR) repeat protein